MSADIIQAEYETLEAIAGRFMRQAELTQQMEHKLRSQIDNLTQTGWVGQGAEAFSREVESNVLPAWQRLYGALEASHQTTLEITHILRTAEEEAAALFGVDIDSTDGRNGFKIVDVMPFHTLDPDKVGTQNSQNNLNIGKPFQLIGDADASIPLYNLNVDNLDDFDPIKAAQALDTGGRPVLFITHGWGTTDPSQEAFPNTQDAIINAKEKYKNLPESERPVIIGIEWNSESGFSPDVTDFARANINADATSDKMAVFLSEFNKSHPDTPVNIMTHSLGARMMLNAVVKGDNVRVDNFLAIQGAVTTQYIEQNSDKLSRSIENFGATFNRGSEGSVSSLLRRDDGDTTLRGYEGYTRGGTALGRGADKIDSSKIEIKAIPTYGLERDQKKNWWDPKTEAHLGLDDEVVHKYIFGEFFSGDHPFGNRRN